MCAHHNSQVPHETRRRFDRRRTRHREPGRSVGLVKAGRFAQGGRTFLGVVVDDKTVAEIPSSVASSLKAVIADYSNHRAALRDLAVKARAGKGTGIHPLASLDTLAPIPDPLSMLNAAVNYVEHGNEMARAGGAASPAPRTRADSRNLGASTRRHTSEPVRVSQGRRGDRQREAIRLPAGRDRVDWECELAIVIGRRPPVSPDRAADFIFGYTLQNDVSDRAAGRMPPWLGLVHR